jgi:ABC-type thiamine transport system ATPase subunit
VCRSRPPWRASASGLAVATGEQLVVVGTSGPTRATEARLADPLGRGAGEVAMADSDATRRPAAARVVDVTGA